MRLSFSFTALSACFSLIASNGTHGYEIVNHADMSQEAALLSVFGKDTGPAGKAFRLGLKPRVVTDTLQNFTLDNFLPPIRECFGEYKQGGATIQDPNVPQPAWNTTGDTKLSIAQFIRYGACFEDATEPKTRSFAHFYNPQNAGQALTFGNVQLGPNSPDWILRRNPPTGGAVGNLAVGVNHYTWDDARNNFYYALTGTNLTPEWPVTGSVTREAAWGRTFQALGHITHHLQDMAQPQHVRNDAHCDKLEECGSGAGGLLGAYKPSAYEKFLQDRFSFARGLAADVRVISPTLLQGVRV